MHIVTTGAPMKSNVPLGYKQTEVGVIPEDWRLVPLGRLIHSAEYGSSAKSNTSGEIPVLRMGNLQGGKIDWNGLVYTSNEAEIRKYNLNSKDVLFNRTNTIDLVGKTSIYKGEYPAIFAGYLIRINIDKTLLNANYLNYILNTEFSKRYSAKVLSIAVGQANINAQKLKTYPIPLPPSLAEQTAIAEALSDADALIESMEQLIAKKRHLKQGAMQELLTGKKRLEGFSGEWVVKRLGDLFKFSGGYSASRDQLSGEGHCYLHYGDIHGSSKTTVDTFFDYQSIPKLDIPLKRISPASLLADGDVVFVDASEDDDGTSKHVVVVNKKNLPFISGLHTIVAKARTTELVNEYRRYCFQTAMIRQQFMFYSVGTKVSGINKANIVKLTLPVPPVPEQTAIATILSEMDAEITALETKLAKNRAIKQGMMDKLLTGKVRLI